MKKYSIAKEFNKIHKKMSFIKSYKLSKQEQEFFEIVKANGALGFMINEEIDDEDYNYFSVKDHKKENHTDRWNIYHYCLLKEHYYVLHYILVNHKEETRKYLEWESNNYLKYNSIFTPDKHEDHDSSAYMTNIYENINYIFKEYLVGKKQISIKKITIMILILDELLKYSNGIIYTPYVGRSNISSQVFDLIYFFTSITETTFFEFINFGIEKNIKSCISSLMNIHSYESVKNINSRYIKLNKNNELFFVGYILQLYPTLELEKSMYEKFYSNDIDKKKRIEKILIFMINEIGYERCLKLLEIIENYKIFTYDNNNSAHYDMISYVPNNYNPKGFIEICSKFCLQYIKNNIDD